MYKKLIIIIAIMLMALLAIASEEANKKEQSDFVSKLKEKLEETGSFNPDSTVVTSSFIKFLKRELPTPYLPQKSQQKIIEEKHVILDSDQYTIDEIVASVTNSALQIPTKNSIDFLNKRKLDFNNLKSYKVTDLAEPSFIQKRLTPFVYEISWFKDDNVKEFNFTEKKAKELNELSDYFKEVTNVNFINKKSTDKQVSLKVIILEESLSERNYVQALSKTLSEYKGANLFKGASASLVGGFFQSNGENIIQNAVCIMKAESPESIPLDAYAECFYRSLGIARNFAYKPYNMLFPVETPLEDRLAKGRENGKIKSPFLSGFDFAVLKLLYCEDLKTKTSALVAASILLNNEKCHRGLYDDL